MRLRLANVLREEGRTAEARQLALALLADQRRALGENSPELTNTLPLVARIHSLLGEHELATPVLQDFVRLQRGSDDPIMLIVALQTYAENLRERKLSDQAETASREAIAALKPGSTSMSAVTLRHLLASTLTDQGKHAQAAATLAEAHAIVVTDPRQHALTASTLLLWAKALRAAGDLNAASERLAQALAYAKERNLAEEIKLIESEMK
jgi:tetratricopeptide (TPR) repeat protein